VTVAEARDRPGYEEDFHAWALDQALRLRGMARLRPNEPLDWELLAEEVEDLGKSERHACESFVEQIIAHLLKLEHASDRQPARHWRVEVRAARLGLAKRISPTIRRRLRATLVERYGYALSLLELGFGLDDPTAWAAVPPSCPYAYEQIAGNWWPGEAS
jgi:hypothetical protein